MNFKSDNCASVSPEIIQAILETNNGFGESYQNDSQFKELEKKISEIFDHEVKIFFTCTGTASNSLALSAITPAYGTIYCHKKAHINTDECGCPEFFTNGAKLITVSGDCCKIDLDEVKQYVNRSNELRPHINKSSAISITQSTEDGTVYKLKELSDIKKFAKENNLHIHMDGARFTNALVTLNCTPAQMTWQSGVDILSFGATKNGAMIAEMIIFFNTELAKEFDYNHKRAGQLISKSRFISSQFLAYFKNDLWIKNAKHANVMAKQLESVFKKNKSIQILNTVESNEIFVKTSKELVDFLRKNEVQFYDWDDGSYRFVTSFSTTEHEITNLNKILQNY